MGKRSNFERRPRDTYDTPFEAVLPLLEFVDGYNYYEPCAGNGLLVKHLTGYANCVGQSDIEPRAEGIKQIDALKLEYEDIKGSDYIITNPPWDRKILHPMIEHFTSLKPTWLLFDADWMHTKQSIELMKLCKKIVSVGRVKWIPGSKMTGKDNCCWYLFNVMNSETTKFYGRKHNENL